MPANKTMANTPQTQSHQQKHRNNTPRPKRTRSNERGIQTPNSKRNHLILTRSSRLPNKSWMDQSHQIQKLRHMTWPQHKCHQQVSPRVRQDTNMSHEGKKNESKINKGKKSHKQWYNKPTGTKGARDTHKTCWPPRNTVHQPNRQIPTPVEQRQHIHHGCHVYWFQLHFLEPMKTRSNKNLVRAYQQLIIRMKTAGLACRQIYT